MGILDFSTTAAPATRSSNTNRNTPFGGLTNPADQPKADVWMNIGYEVDGVFINLPLGMPIDTMKPAELRGHNEDWLKQQAARNELLAALQKLGASFQPGQEQTINLVVKMRRIKAETKVEHEENQYSVNLSSMLIAAE